MCNFLFFLLFNIQVASGGKLPMKPGDCNCGHIPKALEHTTGLPNPQLSQEPPAPGPHHTQAKWLIGKKIHIYSKKWGESEESQRATIIECTTPLTEQLTHCNHMGQQCMY